MMSLTLRSPGTQPMLHTAFAVRTPNGHGVGWNLNRPRVMELLTPAPVRGRDLAGLGEGEPNAWDNTNKALAALNTTVGAGTKFYLERQQMQAATAAADAAERARQAAQQEAQAQARLNAEAARQAAIAAASAPKGLPGWVLPTAIVGILAVGAGVFFLMRKKAT